MQSGLRAIKRPLFVDDQVRVAAHVVNSPIFADRCSGNSADVEVLYLNHLRAKPGLSVLLGLRDDSESLKGSVSLKVKCRMTLVLLGATSTLHEVQPPTRQLSASISQLLEKDARAGCPTHEVQFRQSI